MSQVSRSLGTGIKMTSAVLCVALALLWTGWHEELRAQGYYNRQIFNFKSNGAFASGSLYDNAGGYISVYATQAEGESRRPPRTSSSFAFFTYEKCETLGVVFHCETLSGGIGNGALVGDAGKGPKSPGVVVLNINTANEPGLVYCTRDFFLDTQQSQFECPAGPPPGYLQGNISITFTQEGDYWSSFTGSSESHYTNFTFRSRGTSTNFQATMTGNILGVEIVPPGWSQWSSIGTNQSMDLTIQVGPSQ